MEFAAFVIYSADAVRTADSCRAVGWDLAAADPAAGP